MATDQGTSHDRSAPRWEHFDHGADIGVRGLGATRADAFEQVAVAMMAVIVDPAVVRRTTGVPVACAAESDDLLLLEWLNTLVYEMATRHMLFGEFHVALNGHTLSAHAWGEPVEPARHMPAVEVKGATATELRVYQRDDGPWVAQCVVDV